jgi:hypothetical protein
MRRAQTEEAKNLNANARKGTLINAVRRCRQRAGQSPFACIRCICHRERRRVLRILAVPDKLRIEVRIARIQQRLRRLLLLPQQCGGLRHQPRHSPPAEIETLLQDSPSLRPTLPTVIAAETATAARIAAADLTDFGEQQKIDLATTRYTSEQLTGDWFPD